MATEFEALEGPTNVRRNPNNSFDVPRFVALLYSDITDRTRVAVEFEVEHGIGDAELEFAVIDHSFANGSTSVLASSCFQSENSTSCMMIRSMTSHKGRK